MNVIEKQKPWFDNVLKIVLVQMSTNAFLIGLVYEIVNNSNPQRPE